MTWDDYFADIERQKAEAERVGQIGIARALQEQIDRAKAAKDQGSSVEDF